MAKADGKTAKNPGKKDKKGSKEGKSGFEALARLVEHPLVTDLVAVGAMAAVAAIVDQGNSAGSPAKGSRKMVKAATKAAAAAIGARLLTEVSGGGKAAKKV